MGGFFSWAGMIPSNSRVGLNAKQHGVGLTCRLVFALYIRNYMIHTPYCLAHVSLARGTSSSIWLLRAACTKYSANE